MHCFVPTDVLATVVVLCHFLGSPEITQGCSEFANLSQQPRVSVRLPIPISRRFPSLLFCPEFRSANLNGIPRLSCSAMTSSKVFPCAEASLRIFLLRMRNIT